MSTELFPELLDSMALGVILVGADGCCMEANSSAARITGLPLERLIGTPLLELIHPLHREKARILLGPRSISNAGYECRLGADDGKVRWGLFHASPLTSGETLYTLLDVTEQVLARQPLLHENTVSERPLKARAEFLAVLSHELRTPLNATLGMLQLLHTTPLDDEQAKYLQVAMDSSTLLSGILSCLMDYSRIETGRMVLRREIVSILDIVDTVRCVFQPMASAKGLTFSLQIDPLVPERVIGDSVRLKQVLFNLVENGIKYTEEGGVRLDVVRLPSSCTTRTRLLMIVQDTGQGIPDAWLPMIFQPFVKGSEHGAVQGSGLGLWVVQQLVLLMQGQITVESTLGLGTTLYVSLGFDLPEAHATDADPVSPWDRRSGMHEET